MLVLGKNAEDKGAQLEILTVRILESKGYQNIVRGEIKAGGAEVDVSAEWVSPTLTGTRTTPVICECKALQAPPNMTDWLKFLGKIYSEEAERGQEVMGSFISLSRVNGNVAGHYNSYKEKRTNVELMNESAVLTAVRNLYPLCSDEDAIAALRSFTDRPYWSFEVAYYDGRLYWLFSFEDELYAIFDGTGENLPEGKEMALAPLVEWSIPGAKLLNLLEEREAMQQTLMLEKELLAKFASWGGGWPVQTMNSSPDEASEAKPEPSPSRTAHLLQGFDRIIKRLEDRGWVNYSFEQQRLGLRVDEAGRCPDFVSLVEFMLTGHIFTESLLTFIQSGFYARHIDAELVAKIQEIQGGVPLTGEQVNDLIALLHLTPTGLLLLLHPIGFIVIHRTVEPSELVYDKVNRADVMTLFQTVYDALLHDFKQPVLKPFYFERGIREIEHQQRLILKSDTCIEREGQVSARIGIHSEELGGGLTHVFVIPDAPQPWEPVPHDGQAPGGEPEEREQ